MHFLRIIKKNYQNIILFILLVSPLLNPLINFYFKSIDLVKIALLFSFIDIVINVKRFINKKIYIFIVLILLLYFIIILSLLYSPSKFYKFEKLFFSFGNIVYFFYFLKIKNLNINFIYKLYIYIILPFIILSLFIQSSFPISSYFLNLKNNYNFNYLIYGVHLGILSIISIYLNKSNMIKLLVLIVLFISGARGPFFIIFLFYAFIFFRNFSLSNKLLLQLLSSFILIFILLYKYFDFFLILSHRVIIRLTSLSSGSDFSTLQRLKYFKFAFLKPFDNLHTFFFGYGFGSFNYILLKIDARGYPHNIFLELFFEIGLIGLLSFICILFYLFKHFLNKSVFTFLFLFIFFNTLKSGNFSDMWLFFGFIGGMINYQICNISENNNNEYITSL